MRLRRITAAGFRGIRERLDLIVPAGFLVITGRNGTGKTTLCDVIEYALTGTLERYAGRTEGQETLAEYIWWRGDPRAVEQFVEVELVNDDGTTVVLRRDRESSSETSLDQRLLCDSEVAPTEWQTQICRTSIIRDDTIASFSLDLAEAERFQFVRTAIGSTHIDKYLDVLHDAEKRVKEQLADARSAYENRRDRVVQLREDISAAKARLASEDEVIRAESSLKSILSASYETTAELLSKAREAIVTFRGRENTLLALTRVFEERSKALKILGAEFSADLDAARAAMRELEAKLASAEETARAAGVERDAIAAAQQLLAAMAALARDAEIVGLVDDACPVCRSAISQEQLREGIESLRRKVALESTAIASATDRLALAENVVIRMRRELAQSRTAVAKTEADAEELATSARTISELAEAAGLSAAGVRREDADVALSDLRQRIVVLQRSVATLEAYGETSRIADLERMLASVQRDCDESSALQLRLETARERITAAERALKRVAGEVIEDKLAGLAPLLSDLYLRIRPHTDWREVQYRLRGDVRRFLSLRVGPDLNPRFMFSSGQRRATGLAFLLSVHLSRTWCRLNTLILDDPIQHIDDFRALHFVEVLSAIRQTGRQVVCSVEDPDLARLLARRLRSDYEQEGAIVELSRADTGEMSITMSTVRPLGRVFPAMSKTA